MSRDRAIALQPGQQEQNSISKKKKEKKMQCTHTVKYYSATKENEILLFAATWMGQKVIMLSGISQAPKDKHHKFFLTCGS